MIIGLDFDNTLVDHRGSLREVALESGWIPEDFPGDKTKIRDHIRETVGNDAWTELQGKAYGPGILRACLFPGAKRFLEACLGLGCEVHLVSHKTERSAIGGFDLHLAARRFLSDQGLTEGPRPLLRSEAIHFEPTRKAKVARIAALGCTHFIDDLPETFKEPGFPEIERFLFDPQRASTPGTSDPTLVVHWDDLALRLLS